MFNRVDSRGPIHAEVPHFVELHDWIGNVEPPITDERKEKEGGLAKLEWLVILDREVVVSTTGSQIKVMVQEGENILRVFDTWQKFVRLVGTMYGETGSLPLHPLRVGGEDGCLHDDVK